MKKIRVSLLITCVLAACCLSACGGDVSPAVGYWIVQNIDAGDVVMDADDAKSIGLSYAGTLKLQKSGNCEVVILGEESKGTWSETEDGVITVNYGEGDSAETLTGSIDDEGVLIVTDTQGTEYKLSK